MLVEESAGEHRKRTSFYSDWVFTALCIECVSVYALLRSIVVYASTHSPRDNDILALGDGAIEDGSSEARHGRGSSRMGQKQAAERGDPVESRD